MNSNLILQIAIHLCERTPSLAFCRTQLCLHYPSSQLMAQVHRFDILQLKCPIESPKPKPKPKPGRDASTRRSLLAEQHSSADWPTWRTFFSLFCVHHHKSSFPIYKAAPWNSPAGIPLLPVLLLHLSAYMLDMIGMAVSFYRCSFDWN